MGRTTWDIAFFQCARQKNNLSSLTFVGSPFALKANKQKQNPTTKNPKPEQKYTKQTS